MKKKILLPSICFAVLSTAAFNEAVQATENSTPVSTASQANITHIVKVSPGTNLNLRATASTSASVLVSLANGTQVTVQSIENGWAKVLANGKSGFVSAKFLAPKNGSTSSSISDVTGEATATATTSTQYVNVKAGALNLRASASTSSSVLASLANGTQVTVYSIENGWAKVKANGKSGYVSDNYISTSKDSSSSTSTPVKEETKTVTQYVNVKAGSLNLRSSASTSASILTSLANGTQVTVYSIENGWAKVKANGKSGFVSSKFLAPTKDGSSSTTMPVEQETKTVTQYVNVKSGSLNLRSSASTSASILTSLANGTQVTVYSIENGWAKVKANGKSGFVSSKFLAPTKDGSSSTTMPVEQETKTVSQYVNVKSGSLNLRSSASTSASILTSLANDTQVTVYSIENGWAKVKANGKSGFVSSKFLAPTKDGSSSTSTPVEQETKTVTQYVNVKAGSLNLRSSDSTSASILTSLANGTQVTVYSIENGWAKVKANGKSGYVSDNYISASKDGSTSTSTTVKVETIKKKVNVSSKSSLNMRTKPDTKASIIVKLARGVEVTVLSEQNGWAQIKVYGQEGFVSTEYLEPVESDANNNDNPEEPPATILDTSTVPEKEEPVTEPVEDTPQEEPISLVKYVNVKKGSSLNMRSNPSTSASIITKLTRGTSVTVSSEENGWAKVTANGHTGYLSAQYLADKQEGTQDSSNRIVNTINTQYDVTLDAFTQLQMKINPQTDKRYTTYIREDALILNDPSNPTTGKVQGTGWKIRGGASTSDWVVGTVKNGEFLQILSSTKGTDGYIWYQVNFSKSWVNASSEDVKQQLDPSSHINDPVASLQFLKLSETTSLDQFEVNEKILAGKGVLAGHAATFATASKKYSVNDVYLISHALLETGNGTSKLAKGVEVYGKTVYNMFGIGAYDQTAVSSGANFAYNEGWFTPEAAIMGGAKFIAQGYINTGQDTLYKMRWNPEMTISKGVGSHQYATDIGWATKQVNQIHNLYSLLDSYTITLEVPTFRH